MEMAMDNTVNVTFRPFYYLIQNSTSTGVLDKDQVDILFRMIYTLSISRLVLTKIGW